MQDCIFCKIANREVESAIICEDNEFIAILDANPNTKGMTLVVTKDHYDSYVFDMADDVYQKFTAVAKVVSKILEKGLDVKRVAMVMEGMGINHAHIKLYPLHGITEKFQEIWAKDRVYFEKYEGYFSTQLGPKADLIELKNLAENIKKSNL